MFFTCYRLLCIKQYKQESKEIVISYLLCCNNDGKFENVTVTLIGIHNLKKSWNRPIPQHYLGLHYNINEANNTTKLAHILYHFRR